MRLAITPTRLDLLADVAAGYVCRVDRMDLNTRTGWRLGVWIGDLDSGGWVALDPAPAPGTEARYWRLTALGRAYRTVRICDYGTHAVAETGPGDDPTAIGELRTAGPGRYLVTVGATTLLVTGRPAAVVELRHQAAQALADLETDPTGLAAAVLTPDGPSLPGGAS